MLRAAAKVSKCCPKQGMEGTFGTRIGGYPPWALWGWGAGRVAPNREITPMGLSARSLGSAQQKTLPRLQSSRSTKQWSVLTLKGVKLLPQSHVRQWQSPQPPGGRWTPHSWESGYYTSKPALTSVFWSLHLPRARCHLHTGVVVVVGGGSGVAVIPGTRA